MSEIGSVSNRTPGLPTQAEQARAETAGGRDPLRSPGDASDRVEISDAAASYRPRTEAERDTERRIAEIREAIAADTYLTPDKIDVAIERLYAEPTGEKQAVVGV